MSLDRSLKTSAALTRTRNVLTRAERLKVLKDEERWEEGKSVYGLPKVRQKKSTAGKKAKTEAAAPGAEGAATTAAPAAKGAAPAAKGAAPAAKGAAPAAKGAAPAKAAAPAKGKK